MAIEDEIKKLIRDYPLTLAVFQKLLANKELEKWHRDAEQQSREQKTNRHDKLHALTVTKYSLQMFMILLQSRNLKARGLIHFGTKPYEDSLLIILISSYCHDLARGFPDHSEKGMIVLNIILKDMEASDEFLKDLALPILRCVEKHGGDKKADHPEEGILMLADGADCDKDRVQPGLGEIDALRSLSREKSPIHYFSCKAIETVKVSLGASKRKPLLFSFKVSNEAAAFHLEDFMKRLKNSTLEKITNVVVFWKKRKIVIWPSSKQ